MNFKINFNEYVKVKLTQYGVDILRLRHESLDRQLKKNGYGELGPFKLEMDDEGYTKFQIWRLINIFGDYVHEGMEQPFESDMIFLKGAEID